MFAVNKKILPFTVLLLAMAVLFQITGFVNASPSLLPVAQEAGLPQIEFLGQGPGTFTLEPPLSFLVKTYQNDQFQFVLVDPPTYEAARNERVWSIDRDPGIVRLFHEGRSYGTVDAGCEVVYVQIEDNVDNRRNSFFINGNLVHTVEQGWVTYGSFIAPETGELTFYAEDSIGLIVIPCQITITDTPPAPPPATPVDTETPTTTPETPPPPTVTPTSPPPPTATNTPPQPPPVQPTATFTVQIPVTGGATNTPQGVSTAVSQATAITPTQVATPAAIPVTGGGPTPGDIARGGAALVSAFGLVGYAWRRLIQWWRRDD